MKYLIALASTIPIILPDSSVKKQDCHPKYSETNKNYINVKGNMSLYDRGNYANEAVGQLIPFFKEKLV
ncbi:hypothetical protein CRH01_17170 [Chryseobacterium rhizosphaerae]|nr:hypothetical protein CRH01_17170 [Chryseobacterium rhizosphaerae]